MRKTTWTALAVAAAAAMTTTLMADPATAEQARENTPAAAAIASITTADHAPVASIPADFAATMGYRPAVESGMLVNPSGDCSSPVTLPREFETACKAHDLGYDLLRYADRRGATLGPWARKSLDTQLDRRMHRACEARPADAARASCYVMANIATTAVSSNSWRQGYVAPRPEPMTGYALAGGMGAVLIVGGVALSRRVKAPVLA
ncbi:hypothetical protein [Rhodococcus sp. NPDC058514]|uniref:hypothetical protein n=1 Tax=unclassified Rhodococcus (in: high G+C Gram-positive bacteria) TaxID=192944 RepID=UPI00364D939E